jgi:hypothetical protein
MELFLQRLDQYEHPELTPVGKTRRQKDKIVRFSCMNF